MTGNKVPSGFAAATKVVVDAVKNTFGAAVVVIFFFGIALVALCFGYGNIESAPRSCLIYFFGISMLVILIVLLVLRIWVPLGLSGPPQPESEQVQIRDSRIE